jgi:hypothetical protein
VPAITQIRDYGLSDIDGQRKTLVTVAFSSDGDLAAMPVDVVNIQPCHLVGAGPEPPQQDHDGLVTQPDIATTVTARQ